LLKDIFPNKSQNPIPIPNPFEEGVTNFT